MTRDQFHFHPEAYLELVRSEVPGYDRLQEEVARATSVLADEAMLDLGVSPGRFDDRQRRAVTA